MKSIENKIQKAHISILMVCHGNICRSPMAEYVMKDLAAKAGLSNRLFIASAATSTEEIGNGVHWVTLFPYTTLFRSGHQHCRENRCSD